MIKDLIKVPYTYYHAGSKKEAAKFGLEKKNLKEELYKFNTGEAKVFIGTKAISTGTNIFPTFNTCNWQGGGSEIVTKQGVMGRSTRKLKGSKFETFHVPKKYSHIFDVKIRNIAMLRKQLTKRISWYEETGVKVRLAK
jgi:hypothetical protein